MTANPQLRHCLLLGLALAAIVVFAGVFAGPDVMGGALVVILIVALVLVSGYLWRRRAV
jgi:hypothetical protein